MAKIESSHDYEALIHYHHEFIVKLICQSLLDIESVERNLYAFFTFCRKTSKCIKTNLTVDDVKALKTELSQLCSALDYLFTNLKTFLICPTLSHLVTQIHKCLVNL